MDKKFNEELHETVVKMQLLKEELELLIRYELLGRTLVIKFAETIDQYEAEKIPEWFAQKSFKEVMEGLSEYSSIEIPKELRRVKRYRNSIVRLVKKSWEGLGTNNTEKFQSNMKKLGYFMLEYGDFFEKEKNKISKKLEGQIDIIRKIDPSLMSKAVK